MAKATTAVIDTPVTPEQQQQASLQQLQAAVAGREAALAAWLDFADALHKSRLLEMATAMLNQGEHILEILVSQADKPGAAGAMKNGLALMSAFSQIDPDALVNSLTLAAKASQQLDLEHGPNVSGVWDMVRATRDPDVQRGLQVAFAVLKGIGQAARDASPDH